MKRSELRQKSKAKAKRDRAFAKVRLFVIERDGGLEAVDRGYACCRVRKVLDGHHCRGHVEAHHLRRVAQGGTDDPENLIPVCWSGHHEYIHRFPQEAAELGLLILRPEHEGED